MTFETILKSSSDGSQIECKNDCDCHDCVESDGGDCQ
jgi:hypothetical protein